MARLKSEIEVVCPCCHATLVVDTNLGRVVSHVEPESGDKPAPVRAWCTRPGRGNNDAKPRPGHSSRHGGVLSCSDAEGIVFTSPRARPMLARQRSCCRYVS